jgi:endoglucanase
MTRLSPLRRFVLLSAVIGTLAIGVAPVSAATSYTASLSSHGAVRWTVGSNVYVNLKAMTAGTWKQELWSGTCSAPRSRIVALAGLIVPSSHVLAKTTTYIGRPSTGAGVVLRLIHGTTVVCGAFLKPVPVVAGSIRHGVDLVGMEMNWSLFDTGTGPVADTNYPVFDTREIDYFASKHVTVLMFTFSWEGMQNQLFGPIPASATGNYRTYFDNYKRIVDYATGRGIQVIVAPWQSDRDGGIAGAAWRGEPIGGVDVSDAAFADFWTKMANLFKGNPLVGYRLITEPHDIGTMQWWTAAQTALTAIRTTGSTQTVYVPGTNYTAASTWTDPSVDPVQPQRSNAYGYLNANGPGQPLFDPLGKTVVEVHTYLDTDEGGVTAEITSVTAAREHLAVAVGEARARGYKLFLGEIGMYAGATTNDGHPASAAWRDFVNYANANTEVLLGWTWWAAGAPGWWDDPDSDRGGHYAVTPTNGDTFTGDTVNMNMIENDFQVP